MKKFLLAFSALAIGTVAASAADMPAKVYTKAPPPPPVAPIYNWSGFYIGGNIGGGSTHKCWDALTEDGIVFDFPNAEGCHSATGGTIGGQIGYRWQATNWVFGVEAQGNWANFSGSNLNTQFEFDGFVDDHTKMDAFGLFTGQVGWAWNNVLFYGKGGFAVVRDNFDVICNGTGGLECPAGTTFASGSASRWGGTLGVGVEFGFAPGWSVGVEYDHLFMGSHDTTLRFNPFFDGIGGPFVNHISQDVDIGLVRVNYTFSAWGGPPVAARY
jgi:outer membrane immunogenic protein